MRIKDKTAARGDFRLRVWKKGALAEESGDHNMIVDGARLEMARLAAGDAEGGHIAAVALGESGAAPAAGDSEITEAFVKPISGVDYPAPGCVRFAWTIGADESNGKAVMEFGLLCEDGTLFARYVREEALNKASDILLEGEWTIAF